MTKLIYLSGHTNAYTVHKSWQLPVAFYDSDYTESLWMTSNHRLSTTMNKYIACTYTSYVGGGWVTNCVNLLAWLGFPS